jgi:hypothetical protein
LQQKVLKVGKKSFPSFYQLEMKTVSISVFSLVEFSNMPTQASSNIDDKEHSYFFILTKQPSVFTIKSPTFLI